MAYTSTITYTPVTGNVAGGGWGGATSTPDAVGDSGADGYAENAICRADFVPYQTFDTTFNVGIIAFHIEGIASVSLAVDGGNWVTKTAMTTNPDTGVVEYTFPIDPSRFTDGLHEFRAIAYPVSGVPRVVSGGFFNANSGSTLTNTAVYVANDGNDSTGDGSSGTPYLTIRKAALAIQTANGGSADGGIIYLKAGNYDAFGSAGGTLTTTNRWLTIMPAPGVARANVIIDSFTDYSYDFDTKLTHFENITITYQIQTSSAPTPLAWLDNCVLHSTGVDQDVTFFQGSDWSGGVYYTDCEIYDVLNATNSATLARNVNAHDLGSDAFRGACIVNCTAEAIQVDYTSAHADVVEYGSNTSNAIVYGLTLSGSGSRTQGISCNGPMQDVAFVDVNFANLVSDNNNIMAEYAWRHVLISGCTFGYNVLWRTDYMDEKVFEATNVVVEDSTPGVYSPVPVTGVTYR